MHYKWRFRKHLRIAGMPCGLCSLWNLIILAYRCKSRTCCNWKWRLPLISMVLLIKVKAAKHRYFLMMMRPLSSIASTTTSCWALIAFACGPFRRRMLNSSDPATALFIVKAAGTAWIPMLAPTLTCQTDTSSNIIRAVAVVYVLSWATLCRRVGKGWSHIILEVIVAVVSIVSSAVHLHACASLAMLWMLLSDCRSCNHIHGCLASPSSASIRLILAISISWANDDYVLVLILQLLLRLRRGWKQSFIDFCNFRSNWKPFIKGRLKA